MPYCFLPCDYNLNEVLSIRAQEFVGMPYCFLPCDYNLNEVLSIRAQEFDARVHAVEQLRLTSMKS